MLGQSNDWCHVINGYFDAQMTFLGPTRVVYPQGR